MGDLTAPLNPPPPSRSIPFREDCWTEEATATLIDAWGRRYLELNRGNLRQKDWLEVASAVNEVHGHVKKMRRTDVQCKNRIDTIKKKYKVEKARVSETNGVFVSAWPFFKQLDVLIGVTKFVKTKIKTPPISDGLSGSKKLESAFTSRDGLIGLEKSETLRMPPMAIALRSAGKQSPDPVLMPQKRSGSVVDDSYFRRNYCAMAAAAAKDEEEEEGEEEEEEESEQSRGGEGKEGELDGMKMLAKAIERFGEMYERVELEKQRQIMEMEKKRIEFAREVEIQRAHLLADTQVQLEKLKRAKKKSSGSDDIYS